MTIDLLLKIVLGLLALGLGIYLGLPGRDPRTIDEIEEDLANPGRRKRVRRSFTPLDLLQRRRKRSSLRTERARFRPVPPEPDALPEETTEADEGEPDDRP